MSGCGAVLLLVEPVHAYKLELPPYQGLNLQFIGTISESYRTNITFTPDGEDQVDDFVTNLSVGFDMTYEGKRRGMTFTGRINRQYRSKNFDSVNPSENLNMSYTDELSASDRVFFTDTFQHTNVPATFGTDFLSVECKTLLRERDINEVLSDPLCSQFAEEFGRFQGLFESYQNNFSSGYHRSINQYSSIIISYGNRLNWSSRQDVNDSIAHTVSVRSNYDYSPITSINLSYTGSIRNFKNSGDISTHSPTIGFRKNLTKRLIFIGSIGVNISTLSNNETSTNRNIGASLTHEINEKTRVSFRYQGNDSINSDREDVFRNWRITGTISSQLSEDIKGSLEGFYGEGDFIATEVTDKFFSTSFSLSYRIWEHKSGANINGNMGYNYSELISTDESRGYTRGSINGGVTAGF